MISKRRESRCVCDFAHYCKLDWRLFDPIELTWSLDADACIEAKALPEAC